MAGLALGCQFVVGKRQTNAICGILKLTFCCLIWRQKRENSVSLSLSVDGIGEKRTNWTTTHISMLDSTCPRMQQTFLIRDMLTNKTFFTEKREEKKKPSLKQVDGITTFFSFVPDILHCLINIEILPPSSLQFLVQTENEKLAAGFQIDLPLLFCYLATSWQIFVWSTTEKRAIYTYVRTYVRRTYSVEVRGQNTSWVSIDSSCIDTIIIQAMQKIGIELD